MSQFVRAVAVAALSLCLVAPASTAYAGTLDPLIDLLPPRAVPYYPSQESECVDGAPSCIEATIATMQARLDVLAAECDHDSVFALAYLRVTENVRDAVNDGLYRDPVWLGHQDAVFASHYFDTMDNWHAGRISEVPQAWRIALQAADDGSVTGLGNFMLAMNAHINRDFSYVLAGVGLTGSDGVSHKADHNSFNARLDSLYHPVFAEVAERFDPHFDDIDAGMLDEEAVGAIMRGWREIVWRNAEILALATSPLAKALARHQIETYATTQALLYRTVFASSPQQTTARNAYCVAQQSS